MNQSSFHSFKHSFIQTLKYEYLLGKNKLVNSLGNLRRNDDIIFLDITQRVSTLYHISKDGITSIQHILSSRCQIRIKKEPKELRTARIGIIFISGPSHGTET
eukprot:1101076_1